MPVKHLLTHPPVLNGQNQDGGNTIQNQLKDKHPLYILFQVLKIMRCSHFYFLLFYVSLIFRASYNIIWKKDFCHEFFFFNGFTQPPPPPHTHPLNGRTPLSVTKVFCQCFLRLKKTFTLWHEMTEFNEFSVLLFELNSPNHSLAIGSKNYYFTQMHNPNIKIYQYLIIYIILFFCLHQSDLLNWVENSIFHIL